MTYSPHLLHIERSTLLITLNKYFKNSTKYLFSYWHSKITYGTHSVLQFLYRSSTELILYENPLIVSCHSLLTPGYVCVRFYSLQSQHVYGLYNSVKFGLATSESGVSVICIEISVHGEPH